MDRRVWEYNCLASIHTGLPVYSVVVYLLPDSSIVEPPYKIKFPTGLTVHHFQFQNIKLWEISPETLKQQKLPVLLPLLPLTKGGKSREIVEDMIQSLEQADRTDLLPLAYVFSAYTFEKANDRQWLAERFQKMKDMLEENWAYREMVQWAKEQGLEQGLQQGLEQELQALRAILIDFVKAHFSDQLALAQQQVGLTMTPSQVQELLGKLFVARTSDAVRNILLAVPHA